MSNSWDDEKLSCVIDEHGLAGYGFWWRLVEIVATQMECDLTPSVAFPIKKWSKMLGVYPKVFLKMCRTFEKHSLIILETSENILETSENISKTFENVLKIEIPILLNLKDNHSKNLQAKNKNKNKNNNNISPLVSPLTKGGDNTLEVGAEKSGTTKPVTEKISATAKATGTGATETQKTENAILGSTTHDLVVVCSSGSVDDRKRVHGAKNSLPEDSGSTQKPQKSQNPEKGGKITAKSPLKTPKPKPDDEPVLPDWIPRQAWDDYVEFRRSIKKPMTAIAKKRAVGLLEKLRQDGDSPEDVLTQSVVNGWQGVYPVKNRRTNARPVPAYMDTSNIDYGNKTVSYL